MCVCVCVCVVNVIVKCPVLPPCAVDGRSRNPLYCYYYYYMEVVPALSSTVFLGTGGVHGGGPCSLKRCVWWVLTVVFGLSSTVLLDTGIVHEGGPCSLKHCVVGYWHCT